MVLLLLLLSGAAALSSRVRPRVVGLRGEAGFKSAALVWAMEQTSAWDRLVKLSFCENQVGGGPGHPWYVTDLGRAQLPQ